MMSCMAQEIMNRLTIISIEWITAGDVDIMDFVRTLYKAELVGE